MRVDHDPSPLASVPTIALNDVAALYRLGKYPDTQSQNLGPFGQAGALHDGQGLGVGFFGIGGMGVPGPNANTSKAVIARNLSLTIMRVIIRVAGLAEFE